MTAEQQLAAIHQRVTRMIAGAGRGHPRCLRQRSPQRLVPRERRDWTADQRRFLRSYFATGVLPVLTPLACGPRTVSPAAGPEALPGAAASPLERAEGEEPAAKVAIVPVPGAAAIHHHADHQGRVPGPAGRGHGGQHGAALHRLPIEARWSSASPAMPTSPWKKRMRRIDGGHARGDPGAAAPRGGAVDALGGGRSAAERSGSASSRWAPRTCTKSRECSTPRC